MHSLLSFFKLSLIEGLLSLNQIQSFHLFVCIRVSSASILGVELECGAGTVRRPPVAPSSASVLDVSGAYPGKEGAQRALGNKR